MIHVVPDLLCTAKGREVRDRISEDMIALACHASGKPGHVLLGDASVDEAIGEAICKTLDDLVSKIANDKGDLPLGFRKNGELVDEGITHGGCPRSRQLPGRRAR